jgi:hypothetical protein
LKGSKTFITNGWHADLVIVVAKTNPAAGAKGTSLLLVERGMAGFETGKRGAYVTPLRDKTHGRIWRVVHEKAPTAARKSLASASPDELVAALGDDNMFWRERAQRRLVERGAGRPDGGRDVIPALIKLVENPSVDAIGLNPGAIHAIWTLRQLGALAGPTADSVALARVQSALAHPSAGVRMNAVKALPRDAGTLVKLAGSSVIDDPAPLVRLAVLEALGEWSSSPEAAAIVTKMLADPRTLADPVLADAATSAAAVQAAGVLPTLLSAQPTNDKPSPAQLALIERIAEHVARGAAGSAVADVLVRLPESSQSVAVAALAGLARGWPRKTPRGATVSSAPLSTTASMQR